MLRLFSALSGEDVSESLKVALVQKGVTDHVLNTHLVLHASRPSNFQLVREEVRSVLITRQALGKAMLMDIGALDAKGTKKGKNKDKGQDKLKDKADAEMTGCNKVGMSACVSESWILSDEVSEIDETWITHNDDWVMMDSGAPSTTRQSVRSSQDQSNSLSLVSTSARRRSGTPREMVPALRSRSKPRRCDGHCSRWTAWWRKGMWQCSRTLVVLSSRVLRSASVSVT